MQKLSSIIVFYKSLFLWSFLVNIAIVTYNPSIVPALFTKLFLLILTWYIMRSTDFRKKFTFYQNLGVSTMSLFTTVFLIDSVITSTFVILMKEFI